MKWLIPILLGIMFANVVFADFGLTETYEPNEVFGLPIHLSSPTLGDITGATCQIQIMRENYSILLQDSLTEIGGGWYNYTYNTSESGIYYCKQNCTLGTQFGAATCNFIIEGENLSPEAISIFLFFFILAVAIAMILFGSYYKDPTLISVAGAIITLTGAYIWNNGFGSVSDTLSISLGTVMIVVGGYLFLAPWLEDLIEQLNVWR